SMTINADSVRLVQVMVNLLNNAARYTNPGGQIWLNAQRGGGDAPISVRDTGVGIPAKMLAKVFDMYVQAEAHSDASPRGLGVGLALAKRLVEMHGGRFESYSDGPGMESEFVVFLPLAPPAAVSMSP